MNWIFTACVACKNPAQTMKKDRRIALPPLDFADLQKRTEAEIEIDHISIGAAPQIFLIFRRI